MLVDLCLGAIMDLQKYQNNLPTTIEDLSKFVLVGREALTSVKASIRAIDKLETASEVREQKKQEAQWLASALLDAEVKIGEILSEDETVTAGRKKNGSTAGTISEKYGIDKKQSHYFQKMANHKEVVEKVKAEAKDNDDLPTRTEVLREIKREELKDKVIKREEVAKKTVVSDLQDIVNDDCITFIKGYNGSRIKLLLSDPPYGMDFQSNRRIIKDKSEAIANDGDYDTAMNLTKEMLIATIPKLEDDAHVILFTNDEGVFKLRQVIEDVGLTFKRILVWVKPNHTSGDLYGGFAPRKELAIHAVKGRPQLTPRIDDVYIQQSFSKQTTHPTEKPVELLKEWITSTTVKGETVFDPFAGTGATVVASKELGRNIIATELDTNYYNEMINRL